MHVGSVGSGKMLQCAWGLECPLKRKTLVALWETGDPNLSDDACCGSRGGMHDASNTGLMKCKNPNVPLTDKNMVE